MMLHRIKILGSAIALAALVGCASAPNPSPKPVEPLKLPPPATQPTPPQSSDAAFLESEPSVGQCLDEFGSQLISAVIKRCHPAPTRKTDMPVDDYASQVFATLVRSQAQ